MFRACAQFLALNIYTTDGNLLSKMLENTIEAYIVKRLKMWLYHLSLAGLDKDFFWMDRKALAKFISFFIRIAMTKQL